MMFQPQILWMRNLLLLFTICLTCLQSSETEEKSFRANLLCNIERNLAVSIYGIIREGFMIEKKFRLSFIRMC